MVGSIDIYLVVEICIAILLLANLVLTIILLAKRKDLKWTVLKLSCCYRCQVSYRRLRKTYVCIRERKR